MNFFKSVFLDDSDTDPPTTDPNNPDPSHTHQPEPTSGSDPDSNPSSPTWSFGGIMKTLQVKSDWIESYRRDLEEFGSGLKKESEFLREVASKTVLDLPDTIDVGASKAQTSLESMGQAFDSVWKSTAEIISHGKDSLLALDHDSSHVGDVVIVSGSNNSTNVQSVRYSRFDAQLRGIQCDLNTYVVEPDDFDDYSKWKSEFSLKGKCEEIDCLLNENESVDVIYKRVVPNDVDYDTFWSRYYYRVHRLKQAENMRAELVKRAISTEDEEDLSWDVDDDDEEEVKDGEGSSKVVEESNVKSDVEMVDKDMSNKEEPCEGKDEQLSTNNEKVDSEGKVEATESGKDSDVSVVSTQPSQEDDDMGWDEIEDVGSGDEKKASHSREELRKRLSVADDDEDLSWDIEDDDD